MILKQECNLWNVWLTWAGLPAIAIIFGMIQGWWAGLIILAGGVLGQILYVRYFPHVSNLMGYGSVEDDETVVNPGGGLSGREVTLYTANVCPFCPIVKERLQELKDDLDFDLKEVDVTFQPTLIKEKGFRSVPVIEYDGRHLVGNATTAELSSFLTDSTETDR